MCTIILGGSITSALTHFALLGLADIAENQFGRGITLGWTDAPQPNAWLEVPRATRGELARAVIEATSITTRNWPLKRVDYSSKAVASPFSPRIKAINTDKHRGDWHRHQEARFEALDALTKSKDLAELRFLSALGEASYWHIANNTRQPDRGASRWEMKTRNSGEEFITHRYEPLCRELSSWTTEEILAGLTGLTVRDPLGKNKQDSHSSSGLTRPSPSDNAVVFCALRGLSSFPMARRVSEINTTPGAWPATVLHPRSMALPVPVGGGRYGGITPARLRSIIVSNELALVHDAIMVTIEGPGKRDSSHLPDPLTTGAAKKWLSARRIAAVMRFPITKAGTAFAPERQVLDGEVHLNAV